MKKLWKDIAIGDTFVDGSKVLSIHNRYVDECYKIYYEVNNICHNMVLSKFHLLAINIDYIISDKCRNWVFENFAGYMIPTYVDKHIYIYDKKYKKVEETEKIVQYDLSYDEKNHIIWLPIISLYKLIEEGQKIICNNIEILNIEPVGLKEVFCVETDSHKFEANGLIHHNSVTLRNIIFHCLTHGENISIALIDLKYTEFTPFKDVKNVVAVANTVREAAEIMRIAKECMYKRNQEMSKIGINDIKDYKPQKPTDEVMIFNRKFNDNDKVEIRLTNGEVKTLTVKEVEQYLK